MIKTSYFRNRAEPNQAKPNQAEMKRNKKKTPRQTRQVVTFCAPCSWFGVGATTTTASASTPTSPPCEPRPSSDDGSHQLRAIQFEPSGPENHGPQPLLTRQHKEHEAPGKARKRREKKDNQKHQVMLGRQPTPSLRIRKQNFEEPPPLSI